MALRLREEIKAPIRLGVASEHDQAALDSALSAERPFPIKSHIATVPVADMLAELDAKKETGYLCAIVLRAMKQHANRAVRNPQLNQLKVTKELFTAPAGRATLAHFFPK